jgi:SNF2 family DNA or RNA helicase
MMKAKDMNLRDAVEFLRSTSDGARTEDNKGFNKYDAKFIDKLRQSGSWSMGQQEAVWDILQKYHKQFESHGIDLEEIDRPDFESQHTVSVFRTGQPLCIQFEYGCDNFSDIKQQIKNCNFDFKKQFNDGNGNVIENVWVYYKPDQDVVECVKSLKDQFDNPFDIEDGALEISEHTESKDKDNHDVSVTRQLNGGGDPLDGYYRFDIDTDADQFTEIKDTIKPYGEFNKRDQYNWWVSPDRVTDVYQDLEQYDVDWGGHDDTIEEELKKQTELANISEDDGLDVEQPDAIELDLYDFQKSTLKYVREKKKAFIAHEMGLGKSACAIASVEDLDSYPALVVMPASMKRKWYKEYDKFNSSRDCYILQGQGGDIQQGKDVYLCNYSILHHRVDELKEMDFEAIVLDEIHRIKNEDAKRTKTVKALTEKHEPEVRLGLSGTPFKNRPEELIEPLRFLGCFDSFGGWKYFVKTYCDGEYINAPWGSYWETDGASNLDELNEELRKHCMVRYTKNDVYEELPDRQRSFVPFDMDTSDYDQIEKEIIEEIKEKRQQEIQELADEVNSIEDKLKQAETEQGQQELGDEYKTAKQKLESKRKADNEVNFRKLGQLRQAVLDLKLDECIKWIKDKLNDVDKLIVFAHHVEATEEIYEQFEDKAVLVNGQSGMEPSEAEEMFQNNDDIELFVGNMDSAGEGLTLTEAENIAFIEFPWTPGMVDQCESRCFGRVNDPHGVNSYFLYVENTIEDYMLELLDEKLEWFEKAINNADTDVTLSDTAMRAEVFSKIAA